MQVDVALYNLVVECLELGKCLLNELLCRWFPGADDATGVRCIDKRFLVPSGVGRRRWLVELRMFPGGLRHISC